MNNFNLPLWSSFKIFAASLFACLAVFPVFAEKTTRSATTVTFSEISPNYKRSKLPSGRFEKESYAFAEGNLIDRSGQDESLTSLSFREIGGLLAEALLEADYVPTQNPVDTDLLIVVSWGKTTPGDTGMGDLAVDQVSDAMSKLQQLDEAGGPGGTTMEAEYLHELEYMADMQEMAQASRDNANAHNATMLGYDSALRRAAEMANSFAPMLSDREELLEELEVPRYFVVLQVYDFQKLWKEKKRDLVWTSRFSIRAKGRQFDQELLAMAMASCSEFGKASKSQKRSVGSARVEFGELEYLGEEKK